MKSWNELRKAATALASISILLCALSAHGAHFAPWGGRADAPYSIGMSASAEIPVLEMSAAGYLSQWSAAGVAVGLHGTDVATAGFNELLYGVPQDSLTSQGLQALGLSQDSANGIDAGLSMAGTMGVGAATSRSSAVIEDILSEFRQATAVSRSESVQFGSNANQLYHAFRHVDEMGLDRTVVQKAIRDNIGALANQIVPGRSFIHTVVVEGQRLQYNAYKLPSGVINVGRINALP